MTEPTEIEKDAETCQDGLALLAGVGVCTPEEGYGSNIQWLMSDLKSAFRERDAEIERLKQQLAEKPTLPQMLDAAPMLQWRKCWECDHVGLHAENMVPWVLCHKCKSADTRQMVKESKSLQHYAKATNPDGGGD